MRRSWASDSESGGFCPCPAALGPGWLLLPAGEGGGANEGAGGAAGGGCDGWFRCNGGRAGGLTDLGSMAASELVSWTVPASSPSDALGVDRTSPNVREGHREFIVSGDC